jgi:hypothetical protein
LSDIEKHGGGTAPALVDDDAMTGLEDFDSSDAVMPRLRIIGSEAKFEDNLTGEKHDEITCIMLGLVKQRILWAEEVGEGEGPLCRSLDFQTGLPFIKEFPWKQSGFSAPPADADGVTNTCGNCALKEWGSNPRGSTPWCSEQHTFPLLLQTGDLWMPAILTLQRSGIKPSKAYVSSFVRSKSPLYTAITRITLQPQKRGTVDYAVPQLIRTGATDETDWPEYARQYRDIRAFLQTPMTASEDAEPAAPVPAAPPKPSYADDDEPPF